MTIDRRTLLTTSAAGAGLLGVGASGFLALNVGSSAGSSIPKNSDFPKLPIGMNLAGIADWEPGFPFRNVFLGSRSWLTRNLDGSGPHSTETQSSFQYDNDGYPLQVPVASPGNPVLQTVFTYLPNSPKPGVYILLHEGEGEFEGAGSTKLLWSSPGRVKLRLSHPPDGTVPIVIKRSKLGNHVRNIRLVAEADEKVDLDASPFLPEFLDFCRPFHCLRFMDWGSTNNSLEEAWESRKSRTFYTQVGRTGDPEATYGPAPTQFQYMYSGGVAIEYMIQLCNKLQINPWFCIPHRATDDYIAQFARLVKEQLDPRLKVYVEYSNEIWNWQFHQAGWMLRSPLAGALVEAKGGSPWKNTSKKEGKDHPERIGALFRRAFAIWEREWTGADRTRLIRVCAVQAAWADASQRTVKWCVENGGADVVSPAAYAGPNKETYDSWEAAGESLTPQQVVADVMSGRDMARSENSTAAIVRYAAERGVKYVAYEGGQHIQPKGQAELPYNAALGAAQYHPAMYDLYVEMLRLHRDLGCEMFCHFSSVGRQGTRWGSWGAKASYEEADDVSPKMRALVAVNVKNTII